MRKKTKTNNINVFKYTIYPKELSAYILITITFLSIFSISFYVILKVILSENINMMESLVFLFFIAMVLLPTTYFILSLYMLLFRKIYVETTECHLKIKKVFVTHTVKISDIDSIEEKSEYRNPFTRIIIKIKPTVHGKHNIKIKFPVIWFSNNDLNNLISYLRKRNKSIYYRTYRVYHSDKKSDSKEKFNK